MMTKNKILVFSVSAVVSAIVSFLLVSALGRGCGSVAFEASMERAAAELNKTLPQMVDKQTRFDATKAGPGMKFSYFYTILHVSAKQSDLAGFQQAMRAKLLAAYRDKPKMKNFRDHNVELVYQYRDEAGAMICEIAIAPKDFPPPPAQP